MSKEDRLEALKHRIRVFCEDRDWKQFHDPKNLALSLTLEASEVLELFQWTTNNDIKKGKEAELADELADVLYWILMLSNHFNIDVLDALAQKMTKNEKKYPIEKSKGRAKKYNEL